MAERTFKDLKRETLHVPEPQTPKNSEPEVEAPSLVQLQRYLGNQGVQRLMKQGRINLATGGVLQAKLNVTAAGDAYEQEADKMANQVVNGGETAQREAESAEGEGEEIAMKRDLVQRADEAGESEDEEVSMKRDTIQRADEAGESEDEEVSMKRDLVQRADEGGESEEEETAELDMKRDTVQREEGGEDEGEELSAKRTDPAAAFEVGGGIEETIQSERGSGQAIPDQTRNFLENGFGQDFSGVHIHADKQADTLNRSLSARAFTVGSDIFFRSGEYDPGSHAGKELLAHELTHVVQQGGSKVQKKKEDE